MSKQASSRRYRAAPCDALIIQPLDAMTLVYHKPSGITHMVAEPVPQILAAMDGDIVDVTSVTERLAAQFDLGNDAEIIITQRLEELAQLGLVDVVR